MKRRGPFAEADSVRPSVVVLSSRRRGPAVASAIGLALAQACGSPCALVAAVGESAPPAFSLAPASRRVAALLRRAGQDARARGRLVWISDPREASDDPAAIAAALTAELQRTAGIGAPAVLAVPFARCDALDRVLAWHDGIVVVGEPDATPAVVTLALASLERLGRPVAAVAAPRKLEAAVAAAGLAAPAFAVAAVAQLGVGGGAR